MNRMLYPPVVTWTLFVVILCSPASASELSQQPVSPEDIRQQQLHVERSALADAERRAISRQSLRELYSRAQKTQELLAVLKTKADSFFKNMDTLLDSDRGKQLALDPIATRVFKDKKDHPCVSFTEIADRTDQGSALLDRLSMSLSGPEVGFAPSQQTQNQVNELYFWVQDRSKQLDRDISTLNDLLRKAPSDIDVAKVKTLRVILDGLEAALDKSLADCRMQGEEKAAPEVQKIAVDAACFARVQRALADVESRKKEMEAQILKINAETETALLRQKTEAARDLAAAQEKYRDDLAELQRSRKDAEAKRQAKDIRAGLTRAAMLARATREQKVVLAHSDEVRSLLAPFITPGYWIPRESVPSYERQPMSLSKLRAAGALDPTAAGLHELLVIATFPGDKARPRWGYLPNIAAVSPEQHDQICQAQQYLIELGQVMVEERMLTR